MLDRNYINEAIRIRKEYLSNLSNVNELDNIYYDLLIEFNNLKTKIDDIENKHQNVDEQYLFKLLEDINEKITNTSNKIKPFKNNIEKLNKEQSILYKNIKEKYPKLSDDDLYNELIPIIKNIDDNFDN